MAQEKRLLSRGNRWQVSVAWCTVMYRSSAPFPPAQFELYKPLCISCQFYIYIVIFPLILSVFYFFTGCIWCPESYGGIESLWWYDGKYQDKTMVPKNDQRHRRKSCFALRKKKERSYMGIDCSSRALKTDQTRNCEMYLLSRIFMVNAFYLFQLEHNGHKLVPSAIR